MTELHQEFIVGISWLASQGVEAGFFNLSPMDWFPVDHPFVDAPETSIETRAFVLASGGDIVGYQWEIRHIYFRIVPFGSKREKGVVRYTEEPEKLLPNMEKIPARSIHRIVSLAHLEAMRRAVLVNIPIPLSAGFEEYERLAQEIEKIPTWVEGDSYRAQVSMRKQAAEIVRNQGLREMNASSRLDLAIRLVEVVGRIMADEYEAAELEPRDGYLEAIDPIFEKIKFLKNTEESNVQEK